VLFPAVALNRKAWKQTWLISSLSASLGCLFLVYLAHTLGFSGLESHYPNLTHSHDWDRIEFWVYRWGALTIFGVATLPLPLSPVLMMAGILRISYPATFLALLLGKLLKYLAYSVIALKFPEEIAALRKHVFNHRA
jgi:membrane protein YqaA with SNARE-associated domain